MKGRRWKILGVVILVLALVYLVPIVVSSSKARPLYGDFDIGTWCVGGHEIFLHLGEEEEVIFRIRLDVSKHWIISERKSLREELKQVNIPWRTWLPTLLPEH